MRILGKRGASYSNGYDPRRVTPDSLGKGTRKRTPPLFAASETFVLLKGEHRILLFFSLYWVLISVTVIKWHVFICLRS